MKRAEKLLREWVAELEASAPKVQGKTVKELLDQWQLRHKDDYSPTSWAAYETNTRLHIRPALGPLQLADLSVEAIEKYLYETLVAKKLAPATRDKNRVILVAALDCAQRWGWVRTNPARASKPVKVPARETAPPSAGDVKALLDAASGAPMLYAYLWLSADCGPRRGMMVGLRWDDVDLDAGMVRWRRSAVIGGAGQGTVIRERTKTGADWSVSLAPPTVVALRDLRKLGIEEAESEGAVWTERRFVFTSDPAGLKPWYVTTPTTAMARLSKQVGVDVSPHDLRHYMASQWLSKGMSAKKVMARGGWTSLGSLNRYAGWVPGDDGNDAALMADIIERVEDAPTQRWDWPLRLSKGGIGA